MCKGPVVGESLASRRVQKGPCVSGGKNEREQGWKGFSVLWPDAKVAGLEAERRFVLEMGKQVT